MLVSCLMLWLGLSFGWSLDMLKLIFKAQLLLVVFLLGKWSYGLSFDSDGFGIFIPNVGGYHYSLINSEDSGVYQ